MRFTALLVCIGLLGGVAAARAADPVGSVTRQQGSVVVLRGTAPEPLIVGSSVFAADNVRTGPASKVRIEGGDGLVIVIGPASEVMIARYVREPGHGLVEAALSLVRGIVRLVGEPTAGPRRIEVDTATALASVRSTDWLVDLTEKGTGVFVARGSVEVRGRAGGAVVLAPGEGTDVAAGQQPTAPKRWGAARRDAALARTDL
ncbi:MAG: FecR family protein [Geminicoccaceae bacterium]